MYRRPVKGLQQKSSDVSRADKGRKKLQNFNRVESRAMSGDEVFSRVKEKTSVPLAVTETLGK